MVTFILPLEALQWESQSVEGKGVEKTNQVENSEKTLVYLKQCEVQIIHRISFISSSVTVFSWSEVVDSEYWSWGGNTPWMGPDNVYQTQEPGIESSFSRHLILALWCCTFKCISEAWILSHFTFILFYTLFLGPAFFFFIQLHNAVKCYSMPRWCLALCNPYIPYTNECQIRSD